MLEILQSFINKLEYDHSVIARTEETGLDAYA